MGRAFLAQKIGWKFKVIDNLYYPEFIRLIKFYSDPEGFSKPKLTEEEIEKRVEDIKRKNKELELKAMKKKGLIKKDGDK